LKTIVILTNFPITTKIEGQLAKEFDLYGKYFEI